MQRCLLESSFVSEQLTHISDKCGTPLLNGSIFNVAISGAWCSKHLGLHRKYQLLPSDQHHLQQSNHMHMQLEMTH